MGKDGEREDGGRELKRLARRRRTEQNSPGDGHTDGLNVYLVLEPNERSQELKE